MRPSAFRVVVALVAAFVATSGGLPVGSHASPVRARTDAAAAPTGAAAGGPGAITVVALPDTQYYARAAAMGRRDAFAEQAAWIAANAEARGIRLVVHEGDVVDDRCSAGQWSAASRAMSRLDGHVPWTVLAGNHDLYDYRHRCPGTRTRFGAVFAASRLQAAGGLAWGGARSSGGVVDTWHRVPLGSGRDLVVVSLHFGPDEATIRWAQHVLDTHRGDVAMLVTHDYLDADGRLRGAAPARQLQLPAEAGQLRGSDIWRRLVLPNSQVRVVLSGHVIQCPRVEPTCARRGVSAARITRRADGTRVAQLLANYQLRRDGGGGFLRLITFDPTADRLLVRTYSPVLRRSLTDARDRFVVGGLGLAS